MHLIKKTKGVERGVFSLKTDTVPWQGICRNERMEALHSYLSCRLQFIKHSGWAQQRDKALAHSSGSVRWLHCTHSVHEVKKVLLTGGIHISYFILYISFLAQIDKKVCHPSPHTWSITHSKIPLEYKAIFHPKMLRSF